MNIALISLIISVIFTIAGMVAGFGRIAFKGGTLFNRIEQLENKFEHLENKFDEEHKEVRRLHDSVLKIQLFLKNVKNGVFTFSDRHSPRTLNDLGQKLFNEMHGQEFIDRNKVKLFEDIDKYNPQTALDVEDSAQTVFFNLVNDSIFKPIKDFVYNCPVQQGKDFKGNDIPVDVTLDNACYILALPLRDAYLAKHPELDPNRRSATASE